MTEGFSAESVSFVFRHQSLPNELASREASTEAAQIPPISLAFLHFLAGSANRTGALMQKAPVFSRSSRARTGNRTGRTSKIPNKIKGPHGFTGLTPYIPLSPRQSLLRHHTGGGCVPIDPAALNQPDLLFIAPAFRQHLAA